MDRRQFRCILHVQRRSIREEIIMQAQLVQRWPDRIKRLNLLLDLERHFSQLLKLYDEMDVQPYIPNWGQTQSVISDLTAIYLHRRNRLTPLREIKHVLDDAGLRTRSGVVSTSYLVRTLTEDPRFASQRNVGWYLRSTEEATI